MSWRRWSVLLAWSAWWAMMFVTLLIAGAGLMMLIAIGLFEFVFARHAFPAMMRVIP